MLGFLKKMFRYKSRELEADMYPTPECTFGGKAEVEIKTWSDGSILFEASVKHTGLEDGKVLDVHCGGQPVAKVTVQRGYGKTVLQFGELDAPPSVATGDEATLSLDGQVLYRGQFRPD